MSKLAAVFGRKFYERPTLEVARDLLGTRLCRRLPDGTVLSGLIVETEAYTEDDSACHAYRGLTPRCAVMFEHPGLTYVYFIYGMYNCLNVTTEPKGTPGAVLIRAVDAEGTNGPGKLCRAWQIDTTHNGIDLTSRKSDIWIEEGEEIPQDQVGISPRTGVTTAKEKLWRFYVKDNKSVSQHKVYAKKRKRAKAE